MLLSIYIPTLHRRQAFLGRLLAVLDPQIEAHKDRVELITLADDGERAGGQTTGAKRNAAIDLARGRYVCGIDDDDQVPAHYVSHTLAAIDQYHAAEVRWPDCVGWRMRRFTDGLHFADGIHSLDCQKYHVITDAAGRRTYHRTPNHLNPIRRDLLMELRDLRTGRGESPGPFNNQSVAEDHCFAAQIYPLLKREAFLDEVLYDYHYRTPIQRERDGDN